MAIPIRRVVTGHDANGKAVVVYDGVCPSHVAHDGGIAATSVWLTDRTPAAFATADQGTKVRSLEPPEAGSVFRLVEFPPADPKVMARITRADIFGEEAKVITPTAQASRQHPLMHRTKTIDYVVVMSGEIDMWLDDETVHMKRGDVMVQQGTNHAWINTGTEPCLIAFAMIDAERG